MMKRNKNDKAQPLDERQQLISLKAIRNAFFALIACLSVSMIYKAIRFSDPGWEFWAIIAACFVILISRRVLGDIERPKDFFGRPMPLGNTKEDKWARKKSYFADSLVFASVCCVMDVLVFLGGKDGGLDTGLAEMLFPSFHPYLTVAITAAVTFIGMFFISYVFDYIIGEKFKVKKYNEICRMLEEDDENDLE